MAITAALPQSALGQRLWDLFGAYPWAWICKHDGATSWETETRFPLKPRVFWKYWQDAAMAIGVRFGSQTQYAMLDIDKGSRYLKQEKLTDLYDALETLGIHRVIKLRSSYSGGLHLFIPLETSVNTYNLACALKNCLEAQGFKVENGHLEIFPNTKAYGRSWMGEHVEYQGHRIPLQPGSGSVLLNDSYQPVGDTLERFFWSWDFASKAQDMNLLHQALSTAKKNRRRHRRMYTKLEKWRDDLQHEMAEGWTDYGQTNAMLKTIGTFGRVFLGLEGQELATYISDRAMNSPGFTSYCRHQHEIHRKALCWARSVEGYYFPAHNSKGHEKGTQFPLEPSPDGNKARSWDATQRILHAMREILSDGRYKAYEKVTDWAKAIVEIAHCSMETLYKHLGSWHPNHSDVLEEFLKRCVMPDGARAEAEKILPPERHNPYSADRLKVLVDAFITDVGGGMKSESLADHHKKILSPRERGGAGGERGFSTAISEA